MQYRIETRICQHIGARRMQQDACGVSDQAAYSERGLMAVLSDGMGGMEAGERFSQLAVREMLDHFNQSQPQEDVCQTLRAAYQAAREKALVMSEQEALDGGATVVSALVREDGCAFLSVGDSRLYLLRGDGLILLNREHSLGALLDERAALGLIPREEAEHNLRRGILTNNLCERSERPVDVSTTAFHLCPGDKLAMMSDGAFSALEPEEIAAFMAMPGVTGADALVEDVVGRQLPRQDNLSVLMLAILDA